MTEAEMLKQLIAAAKRREQKYYREWEAQHAIDRSSEQVKRLYQRYFLANEYLQYLADAEDDYRDLEAWSP